MNNFKVIGLIVLCQSAGASSPSHSRDDCDKGHRAGASPALRPGGDAVPLNAPDPSRAPVSTRNWNQRVTNPWYVECEHWGP